MPSGISLTPSAPGPQSSVGVNTTQWLCQRSPSFVGSPSLFSSKSGVSSKSGWLVAANARIPVPPSNPTITSQALPSRSSNCRWRNAQTKAIRSMCFIDIDTGMSSGNAVIAIHSAEQSTARHQFSVLRASALRSCLTLDALIQAACAEGRAMSASVERSRSARNAASAERSRAFNPHRPFIEQSPPSAAKHSTST